MSDKEKGNYRRRGYGRKLSEEFCALSRRILREANLGVPRNEFIQIVINEFLDFSDCDEVEMRVNEGNRYYRGVLNRSARDRFSFIIVPRPILDS
ncbi:MAG: hypothetical protein ACUVUR_08055, partial [bacterium]